MRSPSPASLLSSCRSVWLALVVTAAATATFATHANAQPTAASSAEVLNEEGKQLLYDNKPSEAAAKFRLAIAISPEGRFYYNLCVAQFQEGKFGEAIASCDSVAPNGADAALNEKVAKFKTKISDEMARQGLTPTPVTPVAPADPTNPVNPTYPTPPTGSPVVGAPPPPPTAARPSLAKSYMWSLGGLVFVPVGTNVGMHDNDYDAGVGLQINSDFTLHKPMGAGVQAFLSYISLPSADSFTDPMSIVELGVSGYKNFCGGAICVTPRLGVLIADFDPGNAYNSLYIGETYQTWGVTAELAAGLAVGAKKDGLIYAQAAFRQFAGSNAEGSDTFGLDDNMTMSFFGIGYARRFAKAWNETPSAFTWRLE
ncbi:MAG: hypothetical protein IPL79_05730 [Myxococcales bacterium]|nr:hypothetical protein [Myxococcales bacterium]